MSTPMPPQPPPGWLSPPPTVAPSPEPKRAKKPPPPPPKKMEIESRERSRSPNDTEEKDTGDDDDGNKLANDVCRMIISADDTMDEAASGGRDSATKSVVNVADYMVSFMNYVDPSSKTLQCRLEMKIRGVKRPIGVTVLPNQSVVVSSSGDTNEVNIYAPNGECTKRVSPTDSGGRDFKRPSDMVTLPDGRFLVRDDLGIQMFDDSGEYIKSIGDGVLGRCFGLATNGKGRLFTINTNYRGEKGNMTEKGETDIFVFDVESGELKKRIELADMIPAERKRESKCRFLAYKRSRLHIADLGLNCVYVYNMNTNISRFFGKSGRGIGEFGDPAGIALDSQGNMIVADARNHRLQLFSKKREPLGVVKLDAALKRPSGVVFDDDLNQNPVLYVANLWDNSVFKFSLVKEIPSATLSSSPRPDPEQSPRPERVMSNMKAIDVASGELKKSIINKNNINSPQELTEVVPAADRKRDSKRHFFAYNGYTEVQLSKLFLFPGRGKKVATIRDPRGPDPDARGFNVPRNVGTLG